MLTVQNPANAETIESLEEDDAGSVAVAATVARAAQADWGRRPLEDRRTILRRFRDLLEERVDRYALAQTLETGKPISQSRGEIRATRSRIDWFLESADEVLAEERVLGAPGEDWEECIRHEPIGVVGNISAWNYPWFVGSNVYIPALLAGNAVLYKPSEIAVRSGLNVAEAMADAGLPDGLFRCLVGGGAVGAALLAEPLDAVCFTGSYRTGMLVAEAAPRLARLQLELGGKDPAYVCDDVAVAKVAEALAEGAFYNAGQSCCAVERIYVHEAVHEAFVAAFLEAVSSYRMGDPQDAATFIGPLARGAQLAFLDDQVGDAKDRGAELRLGGHRGQGPGYFFEPTVFTKTTHEMSLMREESFGPVIGIQSVADDEEAAALMGDSEYGLTAAVYTRDRARAEAILGALDTGTAYWNCCDRVSPRLPWSGRRHSGIGLTLSKQGIRAFTQPRAWHFRAP